LKTSIKTITYLSDIGCLEIQGASLLNGLPSSTNVIDLRGKDMGTYIDANGACWAPGTPSIIMYPGGSGPSYSMSSSTSSANSGS
ncbi:TPA: hypothetical protein ACO4ER_004467, partial [Escherichia coli]